MNITADFEPISIFLPNTEISCDMMFRLPQPSSPEREFSMGSWPLIEPTPIDPNGVVPVEKVSLAAAPWHSDKAFLASLRDLLKEETKVEGRASVALPPLKSDIFPPRGGNDDSKSDTNSSSSDSLPGSVSSGTIFRSNQLEQWNQRYQELVDFQKEFGHCLVPLNWPHNFSLAHWVKRQRHQYRTKVEGKHSTMTDQRQTSLEELGFVWDSHAAGWEERWKELRDFRDRQGHCKVPKKYPRNPQLAVWVKCQRRQFKLYCERKDSNMTRERIEKLLHLGFVFSPRLQKNM
jgi:hypothetical protein